MRNLFRLELGIPGTLRRDFAAPGGRAATTLIVHSFSSRMGWVFGGPRAVVEALQAMEKNR